MCVFVCVFTKLNSFENAWCYCSYTLLVLISLMDSNLFLINGFRSDLSLLSHGAPQGSVLVPLLFLLYSTLSPLAISSSNNICGFIVMMMMMMKKNNFCIHTHSHLSHKLPPHALVNCLTDLRTWMSAN